jgi:archaellum component FlaC
MRDAWLELDAVLKQRVQTVLEHPEQLVTEAELRKLSEEGRACRLILGAELERLEDRLAKLDSDPGSSLGEIAQAFRRVHDFREHVEGLDEMLSALEERAREVRSSWQRQVVERPR